MYALGFLLYVLVCGTIAWLIAKLLTRRAKAPWARWGVTVALVPIVFVLPLADEIVGRFQFERLCEEAKEVKIYGAIPVGEDLYTPDGRWRIGLVDERDFDQRLKDWDRAQKALGTYIRWDFGPPKPQQIPAAVRIQRHEHKLFDAKSGRLLAQWHEYSISRGWFSEAMLPQGSLFGAQGCGPDVRKIQQEILTFSKSTETTK